jgi:hypothetical protein
VGILSLVLVDAFVVLIHIMPGVNQGFAATDLYIFGGIFSYYLLSMIFAMYPGRTIDLDEERFPPLQNYRPHE